MSNVRDVIAWIEEVVGNPLHSDEGVHHGSAEASAGKILVCWMATRGALEAAGAMGAELVITHESLYYPYNASVRTDNPTDWREWPVNRQRRELLERYGLTCLRVHGSMDKLCIFDAFAAQLELGSPAVAGSEYYLRRYDVGPMTVGELAERAKRAVGMARVRVSAPRGLDQRVGRVGLVWGGVGLFVNVAHQAKLLEMGCDVLVAGETDDYGFRFARDLGVPMVETSHELSENLGVREFADRLGRRFAEAVVTFYENTCPWTWV